MQKHSSSLWSLPTRSVWHLASVEEGVGATAGDNEGLGASGAGVLKGSLCHPWQLQVLTFCRSGSQTAGLNFPVEKNS